MGLNPSDAEEAFSESLVNITTAASRYDPNRGVPLANWLALNIRRGIIHWLSSQRPVLYGEIAIEDTRSTLTAHSDLADALQVIETLLTPTERKVVLASAFGYKGYEIAKAYGMSDQAVSKAKHRARKKLEEFHEREKKSNATEG